MELLHLPVRTREYPTYPTQVTCGAMRVDGLVRNLTAGGAMIESAHQFRVGARLKLDIAGLGLVSATVAWSLDGRAGVKFDALQD